MELDRPATERRGNSTIHRNPNYGTMPSGVARVKISCNLCTFAETYTADDDGAIGETIATHDRKRHPSSSVLF